MPELVIFVVTALLVGLGFWLLHRDRGDAPIDDPPTLDVQNHVDDP